MGREKAKIEQIMKMKTVRMTAIMAFCFTICQVLSTNFDIGISIEYLNKIPAATLYIIAWESSGQKVNISPIMVEMIMALRSLYIVVVPLLHGSVMERSSKQNDLPPVMKSAETMSIYSLQV